MRLKKVLALTLATMLTASLALTGCGKSGNETPGTGGDTKKEATSDTTADKPNEEVKSSVSKIVVFQSKVEITDQLEALAEAYQSETGIEVEVWGTTGDDYFQQLKAKLANDQGPTVFSLAPGAESEQMKAYLADLGDLSFVNKIGEGMANTIEGKVVGIPYTVEGFGLVYNKSLMDASKVNSTDSFIQMLKDQKAAGVNGFGLSQESYFLIGHILNTPFALQEDPAGFIDELCKGNVQLKDVPEFQEFAQMYAAIRDNCTNPLEVNYDKECGDLATGKSAAIHQGNWSWGMFKDYEMNFDLGMAALPIGGNDKLAVSVPAAWYVNSQASAEEIQAGKDFINWLYTSETGIHYLMDEFGFIPVVEGMENANIDPLSKEVSRFAVEGKTIGWPNSLWPAGIVDVYMVPIAQQFFTSDMGNDELLDLLTKAFVDAAK